MKAPSPAFSFYPKDILTDEFCSVMTHAEFGIYVRLLCHAWLEGSIPSDTKLLARLVRMRKDAFEKAWKRIAPCFYEADNLRLKQARLEHEFVLQTQRALANSLKGSKGGRPRKDKESEKPQLSSGLDSVKPIKSLPSPSSSFSLENKEKESLGIGKAIHSEKSVSKATERVDLYTLRDVYNEEVSRAFGAATELRFNGDPGNLSQKQIEGIRRQVNGHSVEEARLVVQRAIDDPWWSGKKDGTCKIGFSRIMFQFESLLARGGARVEVEKPKAQRYDKQVPAKLMDGAVGVDATPELPEDMI